MSDAEFDKKLEEDEEKMADVNDVPEKDEFILPE